MSSKRRCPRCAHQAARTFKQSDNKAKWWVCNYCHRSGRVDPEGHLQPATRLVALTEMGGA